MDYFTGLADRLTEMAGHRPLSEEEHQDVREAAAILRTLSRTGTGGEDAWSMKGDYSPAWEWVEDIEAALDVE